MATTKKAAKKKVAKKKIDKDTFTLWLYQHVDMQHIIGDFAKDVVKDRKWPNCKTWEETEKYLKSQGAPFIVMTAAKNAWIQYECRND